MTEEQKRKKMDYDAKWVKNNLEQILIKPNKADKITERVNTAVSNGLASCKQAYIIDAIKDKLSKDGY